MKELTINLDLSECQKMIPLIEGAMESGLLTAEEACEAVAEQARIIMEDGNPGKTLGEMLAG